MLKSYFSKYRAVWWSGDWTYSGRTLVSDETSYWNDESLTFDTSDAPASVSPDNQYQVGLLAVAPKVLTIANGPTGVIQSTVTNSRGAVAVGVAVEGTAFLINQGKIAASVTGLNGDAFGVFTHKGIQNETSVIYNDVTGTISATAPNSAVALKLEWTETQTSINNGVIEAVATGGTGQGPSDTGTVAAVFESFTYSKVPISIINYGKMSAQVTGGDAPWSAVGSIWADFGTATMSNSGIVSSGSTDVAGAKADGLYMGTNGYDISFSNTGLWVVRESNEQNFTHGNYGEAVWLEDDDSQEAATRGTERFYNSGTIASNAAFAVSMSSYGDYPSNAHETATFVNTGTISGGWLGLGWTGDLDFYDSGDILTNLAWLGADVKDASGVIQNKSDVNALITGLPTILPTLQGTEGGHNTLTFQLTGVLESVNGKAASGTDLSAFDLSGSGTIVVSGKTYSWSHFETVTGTVTPAAAKAAGPTSLTGEHVSDTAATLTWKGVDNATSYTVKRAETSDGPYTTLATNVSGTAFKDTTALATGDHYYVVSAIVNGVETANSDEFSLDHHKLTGTVIGSDASASTAFDNDLDSAFHAAAATGGWVGLDLGAGHAEAVTRIGYTPANRQQDDMIGGVFQGANTKDFSDAVTLYTITQQPLMGIINTADISNKTAFEYYRYVGPSNSHSDVAEVQFYTH